ncbi:hypothetical protein DPMN_030779, partial [Dreissena polymorpha]
MSYAVAVGSPNEALDQKELTTVDVTTAHAHIDTDGNCSRKLTRFVGEFGTAAIPDPCKNIFKSNALWKRGLIHVRVLPSQLDLKELTTVGMATALAHIDADGTVYNVVHVFKKGLPTVVTRLSEKRVFDII